MSELERKMAELFARQDALLGDDMTDVTEQPEVEQVELKGERHSFGHIVAIDGHTRLHIVPVNG